MRCKRALLNASEFSKKIPSRVRASFNIWATDSSPWQMLAAWHEALQIYKTSRHQWIHLQKWNFGICSIHIYSICFLCQHWKHKINNVVPVLNKAGRPSLPFLKGWPQEGTGLEDKLFAGAMEGSFSWEKLNMGEGREMSPSRRSLIWFWTLSLPYGQHEIWECWWPVAGHNVDYPFLFMQKPLTLMLSYIRLGTLRGNYFWHCEVYNDQIRCGWCNLWLQDGNSLLHLLERSNVLSFRDKRKMENLLPEAIFLMSLIALSKSFPTLCPGNYISNILICGLDSDQSSWHHWLLRKCSFRQESWLLSL